jgi:hypothetical protein
VTWRAVKWRIGSVRPAPADPTDETLSWFASNDPDFGDEPHTRRSPDRRLGFSDESQNIRGSRAPAIGDEICVHR